MIEKEKYLPFIAINEFMRDDYRLAVITEVLSQINEISPDRRNLINKLITKYVTVQGFRNSNLAPVSLKARSSVNLFERANDFCGVIVESWFRLHPELAEIMFKVLTEKNWENLQPLETDRTKLPGFQIHWPKADTFDVLNKAVKEKANLPHESDDNISLMAVWLGLRLPYDLFMDDAEEKSA